MVSIPESISFSLLGSTMLLSSEAMISTERDHPKISKSLFGLYSKLAHMTEKSCLIIAVFSRAYNLFLVAYNLKLIAYHFFLSILPMLP